MKKFKDTDISHLPEELQELLRCIVPEDALLEQIVVHKITPTDDGKDSCSAFGDTFKELGIVSAITRITDKTNRLKALCKPGSDQKVNDESIRDTLLDLANYAIMTVIELDQEGSN